ncbi:MULTISPECIES: group III truncated hemoglobin [unclassified Streptomyces]|uniref:group III truncated hemoglobin n=1 Tax=unclassified Streptomyces TaxID=2593676 RepID=UPI00333188AC
MAPEQDLADRDDVSGLVTEFYRRAFADPLIGPVFTDIARMDLAAHLPVMCDFWETVLFRAGLYRRNALRVHVRLHRLAPLEATHFARWLALWTDTVDDLFSGPKAELAKVQAERIGGSLLRRVQGGEAGEVVSFHRTRPAADGAPPSVTGRSAPHPGWRT